MRDRLAIGAGLALFVAVATLPFWLNAAAGDPSRRPKLQKPTNAQHCVEPVETMRARHVQLLDSWRTTVVREGNPTYVATDGQRYTMSLTRTCLGQCHSDRSKFCDECHAFVGVSPYCWSCHLDPRKEQP